jgi:hypothetical protein
MTTISLIIKGDKAVAHLSAGGHNVPISVVREVRRTYLTGKFPRQESVETVCLTSSDHINEIVRWYGQHDKAPYPEGALLLYTYLD